MPISSSTKKLEWENRLFQQKESGLSIERWCRENQIASNLFHYWKTKLYPKSINRSCFTELTEEKNTGLKIEYQGFFIHIDRHVDSVALKRCLSLLREIKC